MFKKFKFAVLLILSGILLSYLYWIVLSATLFPYAVFETTYRVASKPQLKTALPFWVTDIELIRDGAVDQNNHVRMQIYADYSFLDVGQRITTKYGRLVEIRQEKVTGQSIELDIPRNISIIRPVRTAYK